MSEKIPKGKKVEKTPDINPEDWAVTKDGIIEPHFHERTLSSQTGPKAGLFDKLKSKILPEEIPETPYREWSGGMQRAVAEKFAQPETGAASGVVELPASRDDMSHESPQKSSAPPERPVAESADEKELRELLSAIVHGKSTFKDFKPILEKAENEGGGAISLEWLGKIGMAAASRLSNKEFNVFKRYVVPKYELNLEGIKEVSPELDFLRIPPGAEASGIQKLAQIPTSENPSTEQAAPEASAAPVETSASETSEKPAEAAAAAPENELRNLEQEEGKANEQKEHVQKSISEILDSQNASAEKQPDTKKDIADLELIDGIYQESKQGDTRKELQEDLERVVASAKGTLYEAEGSEGASERGEDLKEHLGKRSKESDEKAKGYGSAFVGYLGSKIEQYNKLKGWQKLAITAALMTGSALAGGAPAIGFTAALWLQRGVGAIGMGMNKRKKLDAEIAANPEHRLAGKSETRKNIETALWSAGYMAATSFAVHEGVEGIKAAANSEWLPDSVDWLKTAAQDGIEKWTGNSDSWLGKMLGHGSAQSGLTPEELAALAPSTDALETLTPIPDMPEAQPSPYVDSDVQEHIDKAREAIERMQKLNEEQSNILKTMPDGSETHPSDISGSEKPFYDSDNVEEAETFVQGQTGAESSAPVVGEEFGPQKDAYMDQDQELKAILEKQQLSGQLKEAPFGLDPIDGHPMSELEAQKLTELRNAMHDPRETGAWPPESPEEKGSFEKLFGGNQDTAGQFTIDSVSATEPHIYADAEGHMSIYGGSIKEKIDMIQKFLTENPDKIVYGTDDNGNYRIPWYLHEGHVLPAEPVRTGGFLGFGSSFMDAAKPDEFVKKIK